MKRPTRLLAAIGAVLALVLVLLLVLPMLFRGRISERVKTAVNQNINARVDWSDAGLSFFRHFPNLTLTLDGLTAVGVDRFQRDTLAAVRHLRVSLSLPSVLRNVMGGSGPVVVRVVELDRPRLSLIALEDGTANWDISRESRDTSRETRAMTVSLRKFEINDGSIAFNNRRAKLKATLEGVDQSLSGDFSQSLVDVRTRLDADTVSVSFAGIPYLNRVKVGLTADARADLAQKTYALKDTELSLNDLKLAVAGSARSAGELLGLDLAFRAPSTDFRSILSLIPAVYARDFGQVRTSGRFSVKGRVKGEYGDSAFPAFTLEAKVDDAAFQYPDLPLPARSIFLDLALSNPGGSADSTVVKLDRFHALIGRNPVDAALVLRTPVSDPDVDFRVKGKVDLADVRRTVKLEGIDQLTGTVAADAAVRTRMSSLDRKQYGQVAASGSVDVGNLTLKGKTFTRAVAIQQASLRLRPERAELTSFTGSVGSSDLQAAGSIDNLISYLFRDDTLKGTATVKSNRFDLDEWRSGQGELEIIPVPANVDFRLNATVNELTYDKLKMAGAKGRLRIKDRRATLEDFTMNTLGGGLAVSGFYETTDPARPTFDVALKMIKVNIPAAFEAFTTVQMFAPVAKYASGQVTTDLSLNGSLGKNMMPLFNALSGRGTFQTSNVALRNFPAMEKLVDVTQLQILNNPTMQALKAAFQIKEGRLVVQPFDVKLGGMTMNVAGSNGIDQSLEYTLGLKVPRPLLGGSKVSLAGIDVAAPEIPLAIQIGGKVTDPVVKVDVGSLASSVAQGATGAVKRAVTQKVDSAAMRVVQEAERQAAAIRQEAESLAATVKRAGYRQADALTAEAGDNPLLQAGAETAANQLRKQTDDKASGIVAEAGRRADSLVAQARREAER